MTETEMLSKELLKPRVDFHIHALGNDSDKTTIDTAKERNVLAVALGKRGGGILENVEELIRYGQEKGVRVIPATEYFVDNVEGIPGKVDLVAMGFNNNHPSTIEWAGSLKVWNAECARRQVEFLQSKGFTFAELENENQQALEMILRGDHSERAWALALIIASSKKNREALEKFKSQNIEAWEKTEKEQKLIYPNITNLQAKAIWSLILAPGKEGFLSARPPQKGASEFIRTIHEAGGAVLYSPEKNYDPQIWQKLQEIGIDGIMLWHGSTLKSPNGVALSDVVADIKKRGLLILGGSDYDPTKNHWQIGIGGGNTYISPRRLKEFDDYLTKIRDGK
ncbi:MAG: hypothetical protein UV20_C0012G0009 [Candidatus Magasanikbacteria bacterium GW2011_GWA2_42_32]|uniref:PHP domain protein n=2 Tax=Patescibacteria group TaxID=1783273 RepID=A0A0G1D350_9BACT|nr:MAG: hypothetical protein UV20_C0012G0009 [Candidatus Magasanikbacteria bacterium GW2011_GWA2_42_32]OGY13477.1 MAG: hypothetical protein A3A77_00095 [Candidatus Blackburnbacteria bacterium RIFCSPLOWO2_01_FULL_40_20]HBL52414.1 hypothetical protein [Candidatus Blackburnbacteria bacterium]